MIIALILLTQALFSIYVPITLYSLVENYYLAFLYAIIAVLLVISIMDVIKGSKKLKLEERVTNNLQFTLGVFTFSYVVRVALNSYFYPFAP